MNDLVNRRLFEYEMLLRNKDSENILLHKKVRELSEKNQELNDKCYNL